MNMLLKSAKILDPGNKDLHNKKRDILITNGSIKKIAAKMDAPGNVRTVSFKNLHVSPGWFDGSVNFGEPGFEERETIAHGLQTAAKSGFTDIVLNTDTHPVPDTSPDIVFLKNAGAGAATRLHPLGCLTAGSHGQDLAELYDMTKVGAVGFHDYKKPLTNANLLKVALQYAQNFGGLVHSFPLNREVAGKGVVNEGAISTSLGLKGIPAMAEELQIARDVFILEYTGGKLHIPTISTAKGVQLIAEAKKKGLDISCSVAVHNLCCTDELLKDFDSNAKTMPPLRTPLDTKALIKGLKDGIIDFVVSDHTPMNIEQKKVEFDHASFGTLGLESAFGQLNLLFGAERTVEFLTRGKTRYGLEQTTLKEGTKASLTLFNPEGEYVFEEEHIHSSSKNSIFLGKRAKGTVYGIVNNGTSVLQGSQQTANNN